VHTSARPTRAAPHSARWSRRACARPPAASSAEPYVHRRDADFGERIRVLLQQRQLRLVEEALRSPTEHDSAVEVLRCKVVTPARIVGRGQTRLGTRQSRCGEPPRRLDESDHAQVAGLGAQVVAGEVLGHREVHQRDLEFFACFRELRGRVHQPLRLRDGLLVLACVQQLAKRERLVRGRRGWTGAGAAVSGGSCACRREPANATAQSRAGRTRWTALSRRALTVRNNYTGTAPDAIPVRPARRGNGRRAIPRRRGSRTVPRRT